MTWTRVDMAAAKELADGFSRVYFPNSSNLIPALAGVSGVY